MPDLLKTVHVQLGDRSYPIQIGTDLISSFAELLSHTMNGFGQVVVIFDENVSPYVEKAIDSCRKSGIPCSSIAIPPGESSKSASQLSRIWSELARKGLDRLSVVVAMGGGVVGDLAGLAASTFLRGLRFIQVPTTLLAQVDSSVGGKTGINLVEGKNLVGSFWQPSLVIIDLESLDSLPDREFRSGLAEVIKYGVAQDANLFQFLENNSNSILQRSRDELASMIATCCELKASVVALDERELTGVRAILNYGHTFGHAIEALTNYQTYLHGEAVAMGMDLAIGLAVHTGRCDVQSFHRQRQLLDGFQLTNSFTCASVGAMLKTMLRDKKTVQGRIGFVLPERIGKARTAQYVDLETVADYLVDRGFADDSSDRGSFSLNSINT